MPRITDPSFLVQGAEVIFDTAALTIELVVGGGSDIDTGGVTLQALYSFSKNEWRTDANLIKFPFPFVAITGEQFELVSGWDFLNVATKDLIRDAGWALRDTGGATIEEYMNITSLGLFNDALLDKAYYLQVDGGTPTDIVLTGEVNQAIKIFGGIANGNFNYKNFFRIYLREQGKIYGFYDLIAEQNIASLTFRKFALPLVNSIDLKYPIADTAIDSDIDGTADIAPFTNMNITYLDGVGFTTWTNSTVYPANSVVLDPLVNTNGSTLGRWYITVAGGTSSGTGTGDDVGATWVVYTGQRQIGLEWYAYNKIVVGNSGTAEQIYQFVQWSLRQSVDIDAGTGLVRGDIANELVRFIGDTLRTNAGVYIDGFSAVDTNRLEFTDTTNVIRTFPFVAAGNLFFNDNLQNDGGAKYFVFFTNDNAGDNTGRDFGTSTAILVQNNSDINLTGDVAGSPSISFDYDYDGNIQRGVASAGQNAPVTAVALGLGTAQYVVTTATIIRSTANVINFV
jgi:hypothetical protein